MTSESTTGSNTKPSFSKSGDDGFHIEEVEMQNPIPCTEIGGYARLADYMARHPELAIFRRFAAIGTEALLYQQAELADLESRLRRVQAENRVSDDDAGRLYERSGEQLGISSGLESGDERQEQYIILKNIVQSKLIYDQALFFHRQTISMRQPHKRLLGDLRDWMSETDRGNIRILSCDKQTWAPGVGMESDLLTFEDSVMDDFTRLVTYTLVDVFHNLTRGCLSWIRRADKSNVLPLSKMDICPTRIYSYGTIVASTRAITVMLACMLPVGSIVLLYSVQDMEKRLGMMACFTGLFSICMALLTVASLAEIFQATAAFAAVLVVFIGATSSS